MKKYPKNTEGCAIIKAQQRDFEIDLRFYYSKIGLGPNQMAKDIVVPNNLCSSINVYEVVARPDMARSTIPEHIIYMIFVEDESSETALDHDRGSYRNGVATIHLVKKVSLYEY
ncbi:hypothetical protein AX15_001849 [Amanita polypyramis BW_CC]|nr:hypothetical protein AX15_001849 [Amanita polypyramis BW_CC]